MNTTLNENLYTEDLYQITGKVVIVLSKSWSDILPEEKSQLSKILAALKLNLAAVQITEWQAFTAIAALCPTKVISFGVTLRPALKLYESESVDGINLIQADALDQLNDVKKRTLWLALKPMFGI